MHYSSINNQQTTFTPDTTLMNIFCFKHMYIHTYVICVRTYILCTMSYMLYYFYNYVCLEEGGVCSCIVSYNMIKAYAGLVPNPNFLSSLHTGRKISVL